MPQQIPRIIRYIKSKLKSQPLALRKRYEELVRRKTKPTGVKISDYGIYATKMKQNLAKYAEDTERMIKYYAKVRPWLENKIKFDPRQSIVKAEHARHAFEIVKENPDGILQYIFPFPGKPNNLLLIRKIYREAGMEPNIVYITFNLSKAEMPKKAGQLSKERDLGHVYVEIQGSTVAGGILKWRRRRPSVGAPREIKRLGLGFLLDYLELREISRLGISEWPTEIVKAKTPIAFAKMRGSTIEESKEKTARGEEKILRGLRKVPTAKGELAKKYTSIK